MSSVSQRRAPVPRAQHRRGAVNRASFFFFSFLFSIFHKHGVRSYLFVLGTSLVAYMTYLCNLPGCKYALVTLLPLVFRLPETRDWVRDVAVGPWRSPTPPVAADQRGSWQLLCTIMILL